MYDKGATLDYEVCNTGFDHDEAFKYMNKYIKEKFGNETVVSNTRYIDLNYYDYTNQNYTLRYSGTKNRIENYSVRKGELDTYPEHNCTVAFRENEDTFAVILMMTELMEWSIWFMLHLPLYMEATKRCHMRQKTK